MLQGHTFHSFLRNDLRTRDPTCFAVAGWDAACNFFVSDRHHVRVSDGLAGTQASDHSGEDHCGAKRSRYLFLIAFLFRFQLYVFGFPTSPADQILRVDILNCMGFAMLALTPMAVFTTAERIRVCTVRGMRDCGAFAGRGTGRIFRAFPGLCARMSRPIRNYFAFFPWASFLAFGMAAGSLLRVIKQEDMHRLMMWSMLLGLGTRLSGALRFEPAVHDLYKERFLDQ